MTYLYRCKACKVVSGVKRLGDKPDICGQCGANAEKYMVPVGQIER